MPILLLHTLLALLLVSSLEAQPRRRGFSQLDFAGSSDRDSSSKATAVKGKSNEVEKSRDGVTQRAMETNANNAPSANTNSEEWERKSRLKAYDQTSNRIKKEREYLRTQRRKMKENNKRDRDSYNAACGIGGRGSKAYCARKKRALSANKKKRKAQLKSLRKYGKNSRRRK